MWVVRRGSQTTTEFGRFDFVSVSLTLSHPPGIILLLMSMWHKLRKLARADKSVTWLNQESAALSRHETIAIQYNYPPVPRMSVCLSAKEEEMRKQTMARKSSAVDELSWLGSTTDELTPYVAKKERKKELAIPGRSE